MRLLLDTHLLLWAAEDALQLSPAARTLINAADTALVFSVVSIWEVAIKHSLGRPDFQADSRLLRRALLDNGYEELPVLGTHVLAVADLPPIHKDPFDRLLVAQAVAEGISLATADPVVASYAGPVVKV